MLYLYTMKFVTGTGTGQRQKIQKGKTKKEYTDTYIIPLDVNGTARMKKVIYNIYSYN